MSSLTVTPLTYSDDLIANYQSFTDLPGFVLLETTDKSRGRYDIVAACPYDELIVRRDGENPSDVFRTLQNRLPSVSTSCDIPFQGGAIGYFSYDLGAECAGIKKTSHPQLASMPIVDMKFYDWAIVADHQRKEVNLIAANLRSETSHVLKDIRERWGYPSPRTNPFKLVKPFSPLISKEDYRHSFEMIYHDLKKGRAYQVNYTQPFQASFEGDTWEMYKRIRRRNPVPFSAFLRLSQADIISFSPERFLQMDHGHLLAEPIKGSAKRSANVTEDEHLRTTLLASTKNRAENTMIVDLLRNDLSKVAKPGSVSVQALCQAQSFNGIHHLVSTIAANCSDDVTLMQAFAACFPGGSITGAPKREAMRIISEQEHYARGVYCGSIGYFSAHGRFDSNIAIRTITAIDGQLHLAAGGGIVMDSTWEDEYTECYTKIKAFVDND